MAAHRSPSSATRFLFAMQTSVGRVRSGNEDLCAADPDRGLFILCDGMGGAAAGEVASQIAVTSFLNHMGAALALPGATEPLLHGAARAANAAVFTRSESDPSLRGMGTTLVALFLEDPARTGIAEGEAQLWLTHVGDSRCYRLRFGTLEPLTRDHSLVEEQVAAGQLTPEQAERSPMRNIITRAIGSTAQVQPEVRALDPQPGDVYLLASDGLTRELSEDRLLELLADAAATQDLNATCERLIAAANDAGGHDNITVLLLRIEP